jgi:drug/metabolite transporter (DMT)-like permease
MSPAPAIDAARVAPDPRGLAAVVLAASCFGLAPTLARVALDGGSDTPTILAVRALLACAGVYLLARALGRRPSLRSAAAARGALIGVPLATASAGYLGAVKFIPVGLATLIFFTFPLIVALLAYLVDREKVTTIRLTALTVAFAGVALTLGADFGGIDGRGIALGLLASLSIAVVFVLSSRLMRAVDSLSANFYMLTTSALSFTLWAALDHGFAAPATVPGWLGLMGGGFIYVFGVSAFFIAIQRIGPVRTALFINLEPLISLAAAFLLLQERLAALQYAGGALILGAIVAMNWHERRHRREAP